MDIKSSLILLFLIITFNAFSQEVSIGESQAGDSVYLEFDFLLSSTEYTGDDDLSIHITREIIAPKSKS